MRRGRIARWAAALAPLLFVASIFGQPLSIAVSQAQYTTYVEAQGTDTSGSLLPPVSRTTVSSSPIGDEIDVFDNSFFPHTNHAIASAGLLHVSDYTGVGHANAGALSQLWFSPSVDQLQTVGIQISLGGQEVNTAGSITLLDLTSNSQLWRYGWSAFVGGPSPFVPSDLPGAGNIPWDQPPPGFNTANFNVDTQFLSSHQYLLTMTTYSDAANDQENVDIQLTGLQVVPEPSSAWLLLVAFLGLCTLSKPSRRSF
jgi:hypothetical protein